MSPPSLYPISLVCEDKSFSLLTSGCCQCHGIVKTFSRPVYNRKGTTPRSFRETPLTKRHQQTRRKIREPRRLSRKKEILYPTQTATSKESDEDSRRKGKMRVTGKIGFYYAKNILETQRITKLNISLGDLFSVSM